MTAFVLCKLTAGLEQKAIQEIRKVPGIKDVYMTFGGWDAIFLAESDTLDKLSGLIVREVRGVHGVQNTETLVATSL